MTTILTLPQVLRIAADNLEAGREAGHGMAQRRKFSAELWRPASSGVLYYAHMGDDEFRLAPKTITYTVKDQPEPLREAPEEYTEVWVTNARGIARWLWENNHSCRAVLARGNCFTTEKDAEAADRARMDAFKGAV